jgi:hypothetical protein
MQLKENHRLLRMLSRCRLALLFGARVCVRFLLLVVDLVLTPCELIERAVRSSGG